MSVAQKMCHGAENQSGLIKVLNWILFSTESGAHRPASKLINLNVVHVTERSNLTQKIKCFGFLTNPEDFDIMRLKIAQTKYP